jgi:hypothetical protein
MQRYRVQLYNVPDKHKYAPWPVKAWRAIWRSSWKYKVSLLCVVLGIYLLIFVR